MKLNLRPSLVLIIVGLMGICLSQKSFAAINLWDDVKTQARWTFGTSAQAGMAMAMRSDDSVNVKAGQVVGSSSVGGGLSVP